MINNSLDIYKLEKGIYSLDPAPVDMILTIHNVSTELSSLIQDKNLTFKIENMTAGKNFTIPGEKLLFYSMFGNLIKNAIEASPENETIYVKMDQREGMAVISIENKGVVSKEIRDKFFQKYITAGKAHGTGLGTYSASLIANVHNGRINLSCNDASNLTKIDVILPLKYKKKAGHKQ
jgi:signal transduction histidine kinase